jgi:hypothetical protein
MAHDLDILEVYRARFSSSGFNCRYFDTGDPASLNLWNDSDIANFLTLQAVLTATANGKLLIGDLASQTFIEAAPTGSNGIVATLGGGTLNFGNSWTGDVAIASGVTTVNDKFKTGFAQSMVLLDLAGGAQNNVVIFCPDVACTLLSVYLLFQTAAGSVAAAVSVGKFGTAGYYASGVATAKQGKRGTLVMGFLLITYNLFSTLQAEDTSQTGTIRDAIYTLLIAVIVWAVTWITGIVKKRTEKERTDQKLAVANRKADSAELKASAATAIAGQANQVAHDNSDLIHQLQEQLAIQKEVIQSLKTALDENQQEREAARLALIEERSRYDAKIKTLEQDNENFKLQHAENATALEVTLQELKVTQQELRITQTQLQSVMGQNADILDGVEIILTEVEHLRIELGADAAKLDKLDTAVASVKNKIGITRKRSTGSLKGKAADADVDTTKKGD